MAAIGYEPIRIRIIATVPPRRPPYTSVAAAFRRGWDEGFNRHLSIPTTSRASVVFEEATIAELDKEWDLDQVRLLRPPIDLMAAVISKVQKTQAAAILLMPDCPRHVWHAAAIRLVDKIQQLPTPSLRFGRLNRRSIHRGVSCDWISTVKSTCNNCRSICDLPY